MLCFFLAPEASFPPAARSTWAPPNCCCWTQRVRCDFFPQGTTNKEFRRPKIENLSYTASVKSLFFGYCFMANQRIILSSIFHGPRSTFLVQIFLSVRHARTVQHTKQYSLFFVQEVQHRRPFSLSSLSSISVQLHDI